MEINAAVAVISIILAILGNVVAIAYMSGRLNNRVDTLQKSVDSLMTKQDNQTASQATMGERLARMEGRRHTDRGNT